MSFENQQNVNGIESETTSLTMINEAVANCMITSDDIADRALEFVTLEEIDSIEVADETLDTDTQEIETAEEVSLKNGVYHEIRRKLCERFNIPPDEIAFIHDADTPAKKDALFKAVNAGRVRVLLGSTSKLGTGINVQKRLVALHHLDEPWKPAELEQREGRILRQGNIYPEVFVFHYVTERSFDGYMLQTLESKARFISQIMAGEVTARTAEDVGDMVLTVAQVKAIASGNPLVQRRIELEVKLVKLDRLRAAYYNNRAAMRLDMEELPERISAQEIEIKGHEKAIASRLPLKEDSFCMTLKKKLGDSENITFDKRERAGSQIRYLVDLLTDNLRRGQQGRGSVTEEVGTYRGFKVYVHVSGNARLAGIATLFNFQSEIHLRAETGGTCYVAQIGESNVGITQSIDYQLRHIEDRLEQSRNNLEMLRSRFANVQSEIDKPWAHVAEYRRLRKEYEAIGNSLQTDGIEVESNTTFTNEDDCSENEITDDTNVNSEQSENPNETVEEFSARSNPFTGLEDWTIVVDEPMSDEDDFFDSQIGQINNSTLNFNFDTIIENTSNEDEETDIFLSPPSCNAEDDNSETETDMDNSFFNVTTEPKNPNGAKGKQKSSNKKSFRSSTTTNQASLWS